MVIFIIHGTYGHPRENWFPWLKEELEKLGHKAIVPAFPTPKNMSLRNWMKVMEQYTINEDDILVGHSIGPALVLRLLEKNKAKAAFLVAGFLGALDNDEVDDLNSSFFIEPFEWERIRANCKKIELIYSDNDPYVPVEKALELADKLKIKPILVKGAGHFNEAAGYTKFPRLLEDIKHKLI